jgi:hypothetical protein
VVLSEKDDVESGLLKFIKFERKWALGEHGDL